MIRIAVDAMGADFGSSVAVEAVAKLSRDSKRPLHMLLVGDERELRARLDKCDHDSSRVSLIHTEEWISQDESARHAVRHKRKASVLTAAKLVADGEAQAIVSAGNTGAMILAAAYYFRRLEGVRRCALAAVYPTGRWHGPHKDPFALILDVGATVTATAEDLRGFAAMGSAYSQVISDNDTPRVALLSNGHEPTKGTPQIIKAHALLSEMPNIEFAGNVEGVDIPKGSVDVIVCEGFLGNVVLKMLEGVSEVASNVARYAAKRRLVWKLGLSMLYGGISTIRSLTDWRQYGGAPVLGFDHAVIKAHGRSDSRAVQNAIRVARKTVERDLIGRIQTGLLARR